VADVLDRLADAHMKLSEGQGAELIWRDSLNKRLKPLDALKIYALKTAPAFEAALYCGLRLAGPVDDQRRDQVSQFARHLGVAFQVLNDLNDWQGDDHNKLLAAGDVVGGRPTVLWALALEGLPEAERVELERLVAQSPVTTAAVARIRALYQQANVFDKATRLIEKYQERAEAVADEVEPDEFRRLLYFLVDTVIDRQSSEDAPAQVVSLDTAVPLPVIARP
jgi:geranylgeranyl pyrophosphate synthase